VTASDEWSHVSSVTALEPGAGILVPDTEPPVALFRAEDGEFFAIADTCSHQKSSLSDEGYVDGQYVVCGWHNGYFCLKDGEPKEFPVDTPIATYPVEIRDGEVFVGRKARS
jgi:nitrite reductase/ring-hydroxylating ferredoxin subunit